uniref:Fas (tnfrsf6)-associated via death domain n=1 Tax=Hucho hucho TaxID=62062 RepID=A0A4W5MIL3_9TELE
MECRREEVVWSRLWFGHSVGSNISGEPVGDQLEKMKFLLTSDQWLTTFHGPFLMERNILGPDNTIFLVSLLTYIGRLDLADNLAETYLHSMASSPFPKKLDIATEVITNNIGRKWRTYGRKLGLPEAKLDHIAQKHPNNLEEQVVELLKEWRKMQKAEAKTDTLIKALRSFDQNYTADLIQTELEKLTVKV